MLERLRKIYEIQHSGHAILYSMEGLRGFAVFLVFLVHYVTLSEGWISETEMFFDAALLVRSLGNIGVDLFFVLSGYLIYGSLIKREQPFFGYLRRRIQRIYPAFVAVFVLYLVMSFVFPEKSKIPDGWIDGSRYLAENFLLLPGMFAIEPMITVAWSLSYEFFFYLVTPLLIFALSLRRWSPGWRIALFAIGGAVILGAPSLVGGHVRLAMFISGILVFELARHYGRPARLDFIGISCLVAALAGTVAQEWFGFSGQWKFTILAVCFAALCWACFSLDGHASRLFRWTPMRWLGNISYSYYLIHGLVLNGFFLFAYKLLPGTGDNVASFWIGLPLSFAATFVVSSALFVLIEKPFSLSAKPKARPARDSMQSAVRPRA